MDIPSAILPIFCIFSPAFTQPTFARVQPLILAALLCTGRRTICNILRVVPALTPGHSSSFHRVFSKRRWLMGRLGRALAGYILRRWVPDGPVKVVVDDTVDEHRGKKVYGKGCHRDAVRSTHAHTQFRWGHKWIVLCILVQFPFTSRPWALPVLVALYRTKEQNRKEGQRHKTPVELARQLLAVLLRWFPERKFCLSGDGGFSAHELAYYAQRRHAVYVGRFHPAANLYAPPPARRHGCSGRPRKKGCKLPSPQQVVARSRRKRLEVSWYGGGRRRVEVVTGTGHWYKGGVGLAAIRWVFVHDLTGTHRDEYFFSTDVEMTPQALIEHFTGRWSIEVTFEEMRAYLGLETTRGWSKQTVLRVAPSLFGLYSIVALLYAQLPQAARKAGGIQWSGKDSVTFSDAITAVRRWLWREWVFARGGHRAAFSKLPRLLQATLLHAMAPAA